MITGKKIVLTGANSGIGLETLKLLVQGNNKILAVDLKTDVISTFDQSKVFPMQCDVGNKEGIDKIFEVAKEKLVWECALNGKYSTRRGGEQVFPMSASMLSIAGANLITKPFETINAAAKVLFQSGVTLKRIVLNPTDASNLAASSAWQTMLDKKRVEIGSIAPETAYNGLAKVGTIVGLICGPVEIYTYAGFYTTKSGSSVTRTEFLPQGKALLLPANAIGRMGYTGILVNRNGKQAKEAMSEMFQMFGKDHGALVTSYIQGQTSPAALLDGIDHYGVMTGIPTV